MPVRAGLSVLIYSGDHDRVVPTFGTEKWTSDLGAELGGQIANFVPWWREAPQTFGWQVSYLVPPIRGRNLVAARNPAQVLMVDGSEYASDSSEHRVRKPLLRMC